MIRFFIEEESMEVEGSTGWYKCHKALCPSLSSAVASAPSAIYPSIKFSILKEQATNRGVKPTQIKKKFSTSKVNTKRMHSFLTLIHK